MNKSDPWFSHYKSLPLGLESNCGQDEPLVSNYYVDENNIPKIDYTKAVYVIQQNNIFEYVHNDNTRTRFYVIGHCELVNLVPPVYKWKNGKIFSPYDIALYNRSMKYNNYLH